MSKGKDLDGGRAWSVFVASFLLSALVDGLLSTFGLIYIQLLKVYGESDEDTVCIGSLQQSVGYITSLPLAYCIKLWGYRPIMIISSLCTAASYLISTQLHSIKALYITLGFLTGIGLIGIELGYQIALQNLFVKKRLLANAITTSGTGFGVLTFGPICTLLLNKYDLFGCLLIMGAIALNGIVLTLVIPKTPPLHSSTIDNTSDECESIEDESYKYDEPLEESLSGKLIQTSQNPYSSVAESEDSNYDKPLDECSSGKLLQTNQKSYKSVPQTNQQTSYLETNKTNHTNRHDQYGFMKKELWQNTKVIFYIVGNAISHAYMKCLLVFLPDRLMKTFHMTETEATILLTLTGVPALLAVPILGLMGRNSTVRSKQILYATSALVCGTAIVISFTSCSMAFQVFFVLVYGIVRACLLTFEYPVVCDIIRIEDLEYVMGISHCLMGLVLLASIVLGGWSVDIMGNYLVAFSCIGGLEILSSILLFLIIC